MGLATQIELGLVLMDTTCLGANVQFPSDWLRLRDAARTLLNAAKLIRRYSLSARMSAPETFFARMNKLSIGMAMDGRNADSKKLKRIPPNDENAPRHLRPPRSPTPRRAR